MRNLLMQLSYKLRVFMYGRYGFDELSKFLAFLSVLFMIISFVPYLRVFYVLAMLLLFYSYMRCFSKNIAKRTKERNKYLKIKNDISKNVNIYKRMYKERKTHRYFKCKKCKQYTRVPKGVGKIEISCRVCKHKMIKKV